MYVLVVKNLTARVIFNRTKATEYNIDQKSLLSKNKQKWGTENLDKWRSLYELDPLCLLSEMNLCTCSAQYEHKTQMFVEFDSLVNTFAVPSA